jgi:thiol-disulfide isomerase/thioredoxin
MASPRYRRRCDHDRRRKGICVRSLVLAVVWSIGPIEQPTCAWNARERDYHQEVSMLQIKVFGTTPPCANCKRAEAQAEKAAERFPGQVEVVKLDALGPEAEQYGLMTTPVVVVGEEVVGTGKVVPAAKLISILEQELGG